MAGLNPPFPPLRYPTPTLPYSLTSPLPHPFTPLSTPTFSPYTKCTSMAQTLRAPFSVASQVYDRVLSITDTNILSHHPSPLHHHPYHHLPYLPPPSLYLSLTYKSAMINLPIHLIGQIYLSDFLIHIHSFLKVPFRHAVCKYVWNMFFSVTENWISPLYGHN